MGLAYLAMCRRRQGDLRTQATTFAYGVSPPGNGQVEEIKVVTRIRQRGNSDSVATAELSKEDYLEDLELLGWIKTQASELSHPSPTDVTTQAGIMADHPESRMGLVVNLPNVRFHA